MVNETGLIHLYCGDGKGKTSCAMGLVLRMLGAGGKGDCGAIFKRRRQQRVKGAVRSSSSTGFLWKARPPALPFP